MALVDWLVLLAFLIAVALIGLWFARRASQNMAEYFVGGRKIPWWLAGTSMLAGSFASDTPLHTTRVIRENGLSGAWFYWNGVLAGLVVAIVFSRMWRRSGIVTDNEFTELRYTGKRAAVLRAGMAVLRSLFLEILTMAWITLGMTKIVESIMGLPERMVVLGVNVPTDAVVVGALVLFTVAFSVTSGYWGVVATEVIEFGVAMTGAIVLSVVALSKVGGVEGLRRGLAASGPAGARALDFMPTFNGQWLTIGTFGIWMGVQWWSNTGDGNGTRAQRYLSCKDEKHAIAAGIWAMAVQWVIRSWPWYIAALASIVLYPGLKDGETAYPLMVAQLLPVGLKGLMVASFFAAFMGTMEAHYNLTASYLTNDLYRRFLVKQGTDAQYVRASRQMTLVVAGAAAVVTLLLPSVMGAFRFKMELVAGLGLIYLLRWLWWRVTATTEIAALVTSVVSALVLNGMDWSGFDAASASALRLCLVVALSTVAALAGTYGVQPEPRAHLIAFYRKVRPPRLLWGPIAEQAGELGPSDFGWETWGQLAVSITFVFSTMIGLGKLILGPTWLGLALLCVGAVTGAITLLWVFRGTTYGAQRGPPAIDASGEHAMAKR